MTTRLRPTERGFTLIEMIVTLCVFVLLAGAVFSIFSATLESVSSLQDNQARNDQVEALGSWFKQEMLELPASGTVASYHRDSIPFHVAGFIWGSGEDLQAIGLQLQANGNYALRLTTYPSSSRASPEPKPESSNQFRIAGMTGTSASLSQFMRELIGDDPALTWRPLVRDLKAVDWRFLQFNTTQWQDQVAGFKPAIVEMTFQPAGAPAPIVDDFWIPPTQPAGNLAPLGDTPMVNSSNP
jgi:prepilin-type N-terminal cleavage/methylation domain-containing protein